MDVSPQFAAADVGWTEGVVYDDYTYPVPCVGEDMRTTGSSWYRYHTVVNGTREIWTAKYGALPDWQMVGVTTGQIWLPKPSMLHGVAQTEVLVVPLGEPFQVSKLTLAQYHFVNQATGEVLSWPLRIHVSRNAAGEVKVAFAMEPCTVK